MVEAILEEMELRKDYLDHDLPVSSIYFGGGTPSLLSREELSCILERIHLLFQVHPDAEVTLEANPDDLGPEKIRDLKRSGVNRLSIGIQSFSEEDLRFMNRVHNAIEAKACIEYAQDGGFDNLTVDLIYGSPTTHDEQWERNLQTVFDYEIPHVSCYCLTVEPRTALHHFVQSGKASPIDEEKATRQFLILMDAMAIEGYDHYEISNFAQPGWYARHNSSYWLGEPYLGLGPSAHSFNGHSRQWNAANNAKYIKALNSQDLAGIVEVEHLTQAQRYNEYVMTTLRTIWGARLESIQALGTQFADHFLKTVAPWLDGGLVKRENHAFTLTRNGKLLADHIASDLFF